MLDTAAAYGDAESIVARAAAGLGRPFLIVSKTPPGAGHRCRLGRRPTIR